MSAPNCRPVASHRGQVLPLFAIVVVALLAVTALAIDMGFLFGQRRLDQNGADAAALAAAQKLAHSAVPAVDGVNVIFLVAESDIYNVVETYGKANKNENVADDSRLVVTLEYAANGVDFCYSPNSPLPPGSPTVCSGLPTLPDGVTAGPPDPNSANPYLVRVTVSSTNDPIFGPAGGIGGTSPAACIKVGASPDSHTTCAQAVAAVVGTTTAAQGGPLLPVTTGECDLTLLGTIHDLMAPHKDLDCGYDNLSKWRNYIDLSSEAVWGGKDGYPWYAYDLLKPPGNGWDRDGYAPDDVYIETGEKTKDFAAWVAWGFNGELRVSPTNGNKVPLYDGVDGKAMGDSINNGFYCNTGGSTATTCPVGQNPTGTYFFATNQDYMFWNCPDMYGAAPYNLGCRDASVATWNYLETPNDNNLSKATGWMSETSIKPERARLARIVTMRLYCEHDNKGEKCDRPPDLPGCDAKGTSGVCGAYAAPYGTTPCHDCGPSMDGVTAILWQ